MSEYSIKIKILNLIAEKEVERVIKTKKLTEDEKQELYLKTFNEYKALTQDI